MSLTFETYSSLESTSTLIKTVPHQRNEIFEKTARQIGHFVFVIIAALANLIADAIFTLATIFSSPLFFEVKKAKKIEVPPDPQNIAPETRTQFFRSAIDKTLAQFDLKKSSLYNQLLKNHGTTDEYQDHDIGDIFQWSATCLLCECLFKHKTWDEWTDELDHKKFYLFTPQEKIEILSKAKRTDTSSQLNEEKAQWVKKIIGQASRITQERSFNQIFFTIYPVSY